MLYALITGANKGIGYEAAKQLLQAGYFVFLGSRDAGRGQQAQQQLADEGLLQAEAIALDVTSDDSVTKAVEQVRQRTSQLDALLNNAGIDFGHADQPSTIALDNLQKVFETNYYGVIRTTQAFLPLLRRAVQPRIVNVSSDLGSLTWQTDPSWKHYPVKPLAYCTSKTMLNAWTVFLAYELRDTPFKVNAVNPGYTATDLNGHSGPQTAAYAAQVLVQYAVLPAEGPSGRFFSHDGPSPW